MKTRIKLFGTNETITRPVIIQVLKNLSKEIGTASEPYLYLDENSEIVKARNKSGSNLRNEDTAAFNAASVNVLESLRVTDFKESIEEGYEMNRLLNDPDSTPIIIDEEAGVRIQPVMQKRKVEMSIEYSTTDKVYLDGVLDTLRLLPAYSNGQFRHDIDYKVQVPDLVPKLLINVYMLKKKLWTEEEMIPFSKYLSDIGDRRLDMLIPETGEIRDATLSYREKQMGIFGYFTDELSQVEAEEEETNNGFKISLNYTFTYDKPIAMQLRYPIMVYNRPLHKSFFNFYKAPSRSQWLNYLGADQSLMTDYGLPKQTYGSQFFTKFVKIPEHDDTLPRDYPDHITRFVSYLFRVDPNDRYDIGNIDDLYKLEFTKPFKELLLNSERDVIGKMDRSIVYFCLYENERISRNNEVYIDENGNFKSREPMDMRKRYRLVGFILNDLNYLKLTDMSRIKRFLSNNLAKNLNLASDEISLLTREADFKKTSWENMEFYRMKLFEVKNRYLTTIDVLLDVYGITDNELKCILNKTEDPVDAFFHVLDERKGYAKTVGIHYTRFGKLISIKEDEKGGNNG